MAGTKNILNDLIIDGTITSDSIIKDSATSDDILLGDGTTTSLSALGVVSPFETIDEGNGDGIIKTGRVAANYGNVGENAVDLSYNFATSSTAGATGSWSAATGVQTTASGEASTAMGDRAVASGDVSVALGGQVTASGSHAFAGGKDMGAYSFGEIAFGLYGTEYTANNTTGLDYDDRIFNIGNGLAAVSRGDAFTILKGGETGVGFDNFETTTDTELFQVNGDILATNINLSGNINDGTNTFTLPASTGTLALTSDITLSTLSVTATAAELNLLDLSGLTTGWVLSADSATTASWKAPTGGGSSPLTTKGDLFTYDTDDQRLAVGTNGQVLIADSAEATGIKWGTAPTPSANSTTDTGTTISLAYTLGNYCNMGTANTNTTFTTTGAVTGGAARVLINTATQPTVTGATLEGGTGGWIASTNIYMDVYYDGTNTKYSFRSSDTLESSSDVTITSIASNEILVWETDEWVNQTLAEAGISATGHTHTFASLTSKPTTLAGYGITDGGKPTLSKSVTIPDPVATDDATIFFTPVAITVTNVASHITGATNVVFNIGHASTRTGTQLDVFTSDITLTSTTGQTNSSGFSDATIPANSWVWVDVVSVSGTPTMFHATMIYTED